MKFHKAMLLINAIFWQIVAINSIRYSNLHFIVKMLLFGEPAIYMFLFVMINKNIKIINVFALLFTLSNMIMSITDQVGLLDIISFFLSVMAFASLVKLFVFKAN